MKLKFLSLILLFGGFLFLSPQLQANVPGSLTNVSVGSQTGTLTPGIAGNVTYNISISYSAPFTGSYSVTLSMTNWSAPAGVTNSWSGPVASSGTNPYTGVVGTSFGNINGSMLTINTTSATPGGTYTFNVQVTGSVAGVPNNTVTSGQVTLQVGLPCTNPTAGGTIGTTQTICNNATPAGLTSNSLPSGHTGTLQYQWQNSTDNLNFTDILSATGTTYAPGALSQSTWFKRKSKVTCSGTWAPSGESNVINITVRDPFSPGAIQSTGQTICYGGTPGVIGSSTPASGGDLSFTYSWRSSADSYATDIPGATSATYSPPGPLTAITSYRRYAKDGSCNSTAAASTGTWTVTVRPQFTPGTINSTGQTICYNSIPTTTIGSTTDAGGGDGNITYAWRSSADSYATDITSATSSTFTPAGTLTATTSYRR